MSSLPMEVHGYYFAEGSGALKGVVPNGSAVISIPGPFISFNSLTRVLSAKKGQYYLPKHRIENSPFLVMRTTEQLKRLTSSEVVCQQAQ